MFGILCPKLSGDDGVGAERHGKPLQYSFAPFHAASFSRLTSNLFSRHGTMAGREKRERDHCVVTRSGALPPQHATPCPFVLTISTLNFHSHRLNPYITLID